MNEVAFVKKRESDWQRLALLCDRAEVSAAKLKAEEFHELVRLYRRVSADLATVRTRSNNIQLISFLNDTVARTYGILYRSPRKSVARALYDGAALAAQSVRRCRWFIGVSVALFLASALLSYTLLAVVPQSRVAFIPKEAEANFEHWKTGEFDERGPEEAAAMTGLYMANNPLVAVRTAGLAAATFGLGTAGILYFNGVMLGALASEMSSVGKLPHLFVSIAPHGVTEISGMILAGASGLVMGWALVNPGRKKRGDALKAAGKDAMVLVITAWLMMFMAAPIEGFLSFNPRVPDLAKAAFAITSAVAWGFFWTSFGRRPEEAASEIS